MGEILDFMEFKNILTGEEIYQLTLDSNDVQFDVCINKKDLLGEPCLLYTSCWYKRVFIVFIIRQNHWFYNVFSLCQEIGSLQGLVAFTPFYK